MPTPRLARTLTGTPEAATVSRKRRTAALDGGENPVPGVGL